MSNNKVYLDTNDFIWEVYEGRQDGKDIDFVVRETEALMKQLQSKNKDINVIVDARKFGWPTPRARKRGNVLASWPYRKLAIFGAPKLLYYVFHMIILGTNSQNRVQIFKTQEEAIAWLKK